MEKNQQNIKELIAINVVQMCILKQRLSGHNINFSLRYISRVNNQTLNSQFTLVHEACLGSEC